MTKQKFGICFVLSIAILLNLLFYMANTIPLIPHDQGDYKNEMYWGSYRPSVYFGMKTRSSHPITTGLLWGSPRDYRAIRHTCEHGDGLEKYGWTSHDGINFGEQLIIDGKFNLQLTTSFYKHDPQLSSGGSWSNRFTASKIKSSEPSIAYWIYYINLPEGCTITQRPKNTRRGIDQISITGTCDEIGDFTFIIKEGKGSTPQYDDFTAQIKDIPDLSRFHFLGVELNEDEQWKIGDIVKQELMNSLQKLYQNFQKIAKPDSNQNPFLIPTLPNTFKPKSNSFVFFKAYSSPFEVDVAFISHQSANNDGYFVSAKQLPEDYVNNFFGASLSDKLTRAKNEFENKMDKKFLLKDAAGVDPSMESTAKYAFSNLIGGMGYWEGESLIYEGENKPASTYKYQKLFSAVPSRPFFPRGFLWDEGFHQLLISDWDERITIDVLSYWLNLMHDDGWIPREQILGEEARSKVPAQFQPQHRDHANPPTLLMALEKLIQKANYIIMKTLKDQNNDMAVVSGDLSPKINHILDTFGNVNNLGSILQFIEKAYPRLQKWFDWFKREQRGVVEDAFRWRGRLENHTLSSGLDDYPRSRFPSDNELHLDLICWMAYSAKVLSNAAVLTHNDPSLYNTLYQKYVANLELHWDESQGLYADIASYSEHNIKYVRHVGYVSLFPLLAGLIPADSPRLKSILDVIRDEKQLWTKYGLRSLSVSDKYYLKGDQYWTGPIWMNINYFVLSSLYKNYLGEGPNQQQALSIYKELRNNLIENIVREYQRTGYIWEQYSQINGQGSRSKPFTGWSALIVS